MVNEKSIDASSAWLHYRNFASYPRTPCEHADTE
jgi:hypothetical protein